MVGIPAVVKYSQCCNDLKFQSLIYSQDDVDNDDTSMLHWGSGCVCVYRLNRRKTSINIIIYKRGVAGVPGGSVTNEDTSPGPV